MKTIRGKRIIIGLIAVVGMFVAYNLVWYLVTQNKYEPFIMNQMEKIERNTYNYFDEDSYGYVVSTPTYLHFNDGCISITDSESYSSLIVWPRKNNEYEYGVRVMYQDEGYEIYMNADGTAKNPEDDKIVDANKEIIDNLYSKANNMWKLQ